MHRDTIFFVITIVLLLGSFGGFAYYHTVTIQDMQKRMMEQDQEIATALLETKGKLENELFVLDQKLDLKTGALEQVDVQFHQRLIDASKNIQEVRSESQQGLQAAAARSEALQTDILSLNVQSQDFSIIVNQIIDSVVAVRTDSSIGSGVFVDKRGFIVTNNHVMVGASSAAVVTYDKRVHPVTLVARSEDRDLALLKIDPKGTDIDPLKFANDRTLRVGQKVAAMGSPGGLDFTVTEGIISALSRTNNQGTDFLQTDVSINPGNSGGPLVNIEGMIVGINTMKKQGFEGIGFAIKSDQVEDFVDEAIKAWEQQQSQE